jgi:hypothetical protein
MRKTESNLVTLSFKAIAQVKHKIKQASAVLQGLPIYLVLLIFAEQLETGDCYQRQSH